MHYDKYQCHVTASCSYHLPSSRSCSTRAIQKNEKNNPELKKFLGGKSGVWTISRKMTARVRGPGRKTSKELRKRNQTTALRFQTGGWEDIIHPSSPLGFTLLVRTKKSDIVHRQIPLLYSLMFLVLTQNNDYYDYFHPYNAGKGAKMCHDFLVRKKRYVCFLLT